MSAELTPVAATRIVEELQKDVSWAIHNLAKIGYTVPPAEVDKIAAAGKWLVAVAMDLDGPKED